MLDYALVSKLEGAVIYCPDGVILVLSTEHLAVEEFHCQFQPWDNGIPLVLQLIFSSSKVSAENNVTTW